MDKFNEAMLDVGSMAPAVTGDVGFVPLAKCDDGQKQPAAGRRRCQGIGGNCWFLPRGPRTRFGAAVAARGGGVWDARQDSQDDVEALGWRR